MPYFNKQTARIKMVALMPGDMPNVVWYNLEKYDNRPEVKNDKIINDMYRRFTEKAPNGKLANVLQFYDNQDKGRLIQEYR